MVLCGVLWSLGGIWIKLISWNPLEIAGGRGLLASAVVFVYMKTHGMKLKINKYSVGIGIAIAVDMSLFVVANKLTTAANAVVIQYTAPIWILVFSALIFHKKFSKVDVIVVMITMGGIVLFFLDQISTKGMLGNIVALISGIAMSFTFILNKEISGSDGDAQVSGICIGHFMTFLIAAAVFPFVPFHTTGREIIYILLLGIVQMGIPYAIYPMCQRKLSSLTCNLICMIEPLLNPVWVLIFYGERPGEFALFGAAIIIITLSLWCVWQARSENVTDQ
jgi:drug/metabolite transporter (DMT)-like permease